MYKPCSLLLAAVLMIGCAGAPLSSVPYDESKPLGKSCVFALANKGDAWFAHIVRHPEEPEESASGAFGARMRLWVTYLGNETELITVNAGPADEAVPIKGRKRIISASPEKCEAFAAFSG